MQEATPADATGLRPQELVILELLALRGPLRRATIVGTSPRRIEALDALVAAGRVVYEPVPCRSKPGLARTGGRYRLTEHERQALESAAYV